MTAVKAGPDTFTLSNGRTVSFHLSSTDSSLPLLVLANPLGTSWHLWDLFMDSLKPRYRVLRFDHPGHGGSDCRPEDITTCTFPSLAADFRELLDHVFPPVSNSNPQIKAWIGVSMGASLGIFFAAAFPDEIDTLVLCDTISGSPEHMQVPDLFTPRVAEARKQGNMDKTVDDTMERWWGDRISAEKKKELKEKGVMKATLDGYDACCGALVHSSFDLRPLMRQLPECVKKVYVVVGELDANLPKTMAELVHCVERRYKKTTGDENYKVPFLVLPKCGHVPFIDNEEAFRSQVIAGILD